MYKKKFQRKYFLLWLVFFIAFGFFLYIEKSVTEAVSDGTSVNLQVIQVTNLTITDVTTLTVHINSVDINFNTNAPALCTLAWGNTTEYAGGTTSEVGAGTVLHTISLLNLDQGKRYYYKVSCLSGTMSAEEDGFMFDTNFEIPTFSLKKKVNDDGTKVQFYGNTEVAFKVFLRVTGPDGFDKLIEADSDPAWSWQTGFLDPGVYFTKIYVENDLGQKSAWSTTKTFTVEEVSDPDPEIILPPDTPIVPEPPVVPETPLPPENPPVVPDNPPLSPEISEGQPEKQEEDQAAKENSVSERAKPTKNVGVLDKISEVPFVRDNPEVADLIENVDSAVEAAATPIAAVNAINSMAVSVPVFFQLGSLQEILLLIKNAVGALFGFFTRYKTREWGIVYDSKTLKPIPLALVTIFEEGGKKASSKLTDKLGTYGFLVPPGKYTIDVDKKGYVFKHNPILKVISYANNYDGNLFEVKEADLVKKDIPLMADKHTAARHWITANYLVIIFNTIFYFSFAFSVFSLLVNPVIFNYAVCFLYLVILVIRNYSLAENNWGVVLDLENRNKPFVYIKAVDKTTGAMVARTVTDERGRYYMVLNKGEYELEAVSNTGLSWHGEILTDKRKAVTEIIRLKPMLNVVTPIVSGEE